MPTPDDIDSNIPDAPEPAAPAAAPTFSLEDVRTLVADSVREAVRSVTPQQPARRDMPVVEPEPEGATDEDFQTDVRGAFRKEFNRALHPLRQEMANFRNFGLQRLGDLNMSVMGEKLPYYRDYKGEIDAQLAGLDAALRTDPTTVKLVHDTVVANHLPEIQERARQEGIRQARGDAPAPGNGNSRNVKSGEPDVPTPDQLGMSSEQVDEINRLGGPDAFARRISDGRMKDWKEYAAARAKFLGGETKRGLRGVVMPFARMEAKKKTANG